MPDGIRQKENYGAGRKPTDVDAAAATLHYIFYHTYTHARYYLLPSTYYLLENERISKTVSVILAIS